MTPHAEQDQRHGQFFKRHEVLEIGGRADDNELDLDRKMLAVITKADQPELFSIVRTLFQSFTEQEEIIERTEHEGF